MMPLFNYADRNHDAIREMITHPAAVLGLPMAVPTAA